MLLKTLLFKSDQIIKLFKFNYSNAGVVLFSWKTLLFNFYCIQTQCKFRCNFILTTETLTTTSMGMLLYSVNIAFFKH